MQYNLKTHKHAFSENVTKVHQQIAVEESDGKLQRVLWKSSFPDPIQTYKVRKVTSGIQCALKFIWARYNEIT